MRNIALAFLGCSIILAARSNSDDTEKSVAPVPTGDVAIYTTISSLTRDLICDATNFSPKDNLAPTTITLNPTEQYQMMDSFGVAITDSTCHSLSLMKPADRHVFLTETFSDKDGFGFSYIRISIGCSDSPLSEYACCDTKGIENFALQSKKEDCILPVPKEIPAINPPTKVIAAPRTCPKWMKVKSLTDCTPLDSWTNGQLSPDYYQDYATYFVKRMQTFKAEGTDIYVVTLQNEPLNRGNPASLYMGWEEQRDFVKTAFGSQVKVTGSSTEIYAFDHNYNYDDIESQKNYPDRIYEDATVSQYLAGVAYHNYGGNREELPDIRQAYPGKELLFTGTSIGTWNSGRSLPERPMEDMGEIVLGTINDRCKDVIVQNLMLDNDRGPNREGGCQTHYGAVDTNNSDCKTIMRNFHYYVIARLSSVVKPGAVRAATTGYTDSDIICSAFKNTDGTCASVLINNNEKSKKITVSDSQRHFAYDVPGKSVTPYRWAKLKQES